MQTLLICRTPQGVECMSLHARLRKASDGMEMTMHSYLRLHTNLDTVKNPSAHRDGAGPWWCTLVDRAP